MSTIAKVNEICRTCLKEAKGTQMLFDVAISDEDNVRAIDFVRRLTLLEVVESENLPDRICNLCLEIVRKAFEFAQMCVASDARLKSPRNRHEICDVNDFTTLDGVLEIQPKQSDKFDEQNDHSSGLFVNGTDISKKSVIGSCVEIVPRQILTTDFECALKYNDEICEMGALESNLIEFINIPKKKNLINTEHGVESTTFDEIHDRAQHTELEVVSKGSEMKENVERESKLYCCNLCGKSFRYLHLLQGHNYKHQETKPFTCSVCNRGCVTAESLRRHLKTHDENYVKKSYVCEICSKQFPYPSFLAEHMKNHTGEKPFLCSVCGKGFRQSGTLHYHMRSHTGSKPFVCKICGNSFGLPGVLRMHMRRHTNERPYVCDTCGMAFRQSTDLKSHKRTHTGVKPVLCSICGKRLSSTGQLTIHIRSHTGEKPFRCGVCSKAFTTRTMLVKHERIHTGEKPYVCNVCGKAFNQSGTLKKHFNTHRNKERTREGRTVDNACRSRFDNYNVPGNDSVVLPPTSSVPILLSL